MMMDNKVVDGSNCLFLIKYLLVVFTISMFFSFQLMCAIFVVG